VAIAYKHVQEPVVPPRQINAELPVAIEAIVLKCLAKNPANRYPSAEDLRADLRRFREGSGILAEPVMAPLVDPTSVVAATAAVAAATPDETYYDEEDEPKKSSSMFLIGLIVLLSVLAGMLYLLSRQFAGDNERVAQVEVPNVVGKPVADAQTILENDGFKVQVTQEANEDQAEGVVFDQDPGFGKKVDEGSTVQLKVSAGAAAVPVPDVIGSTVEQARQLLTGQGFTVKEEQVVDEEAPVGEVVDQDPGPNDEAPKGSEVTLFVSKGPADRPVPNVVGKTIAEASNLLGQAGFTANQTSEASDTVAEGLVIRTDPPADTPRPKGSAVTVVVSTGPAESAVPSVVGLTEANAINTVNGAGFQAVVEEVVTNDPTQDGRVVDQNPDGNAMATNGSQVTIFVGAYEAPATDGVTDGA
jgi:serine/threonine-protein kinase